MQLNNNISFPVKLGQWQLSNRGSYMTADYETWDNDQNAPYAGGFAMAVFDGGSGSNTWNLWWVAAGRLALQAGDSGLYVWTDTSHLSGLTSLTSGSQDNQQPHTSYDPNGRFSLYNLGGGNVIVKSRASGWEGIPMLFNWDNNSWADWGFRVIQLTTGNSSYEQLQVHGSHFPILLLTTYGTGLTLSNLDLAAGGYIASLSGSDFTGAHLEGTIFMNLPNKSLSGCNFSGAHMSGAKTAGCTNISQAVWQGVDLTNTDISGWDVTSTPGSDFTGATLTGATISNGMPLDSKFNLNFTNAKFIKAHLDGAHARGVNFTNAQFTDGATLKGAALDGASFQGSVLDGADFAGATLSGTDFTGASLIGTHFDNCDLSNTIFDHSPKFGRSTSTRTTFVNATNLPATKLGLNWSYLDLTGANITEMPSDLTGLQAQQTLFPDKVDFSSVKLGKANFSGAQMFYAYLSNANLLSAILDGAFLKGAQLISANLTNASMQGTYLMAEEGIKDDTKYEAAVVSQAFLVNTNLKGVFANGVDFTYALFVTDPMTSTQEANAVSAYMNRANFDNAIVINVSLRNAQFAGAHFDNATLIGSQFQSTVITPPTDNVASVPSMVGADIRGTQFADVGNNGKLTNPANMDGLDMGKATFSVSKGQFQKVYPSYSGNVAISTSYGPTVLGTTYSSTICPNGHQGPCTLSSASVASGD